MAGMLVALLAGFMAFSARGSPWLTALNGATCIVSACWGLWEIATMWRYRQTRVIVPFRLQAIEAVAYVIMIYLLVISPENRDVKVAGSVFAFLVVLVTVCMRKMRAIRWHRATHRNQSPHDTHDWDDSPDETGPQIGTAGRKEWHCCGSNQAGGHSPGNDH